MADAEYRHELELELERLTKELAHVRVEKAQQRQRIEHLQLEQTQLQDQLMGQNKTDTNGDNNNKNNKELRTDLAQHLHSLHQVVRQKKSEHVKVKQEWERSQEQCNHLKQTVGVVLQGATTVASFSTDDDDDDDDDSSLQGDDLDNRQAQSRDIVQNLMGSFLVENSSLMSNLAEETHFHHHHVTTTAAAAAVASRLEEASLCDSAFDNDTVITEHTKDSLHLYRNKQMKRSRRTTAARQAAPEGGGGGLSKFFSKQEAAAPPSASAPPPPPKVATTSKGNSRNKLGNFLDNEGKKPPKEKKDLKSASEWKLMWMEEERENETRV